MTESSNESTDPETYHGYSVDDEDQPQGDGDALVGDRGLSEPLDEGYSPPERWSAAQGYGNTPYEEATGETLDQRIDQEIPEPDPYVEAARVDLDEDDLAPEVGAERAGRLVADDQGRGEDIEASLLADDIGIDGAGASAEEAAMHIIEDPE